MKNISVEELRSRFGYTEAGARIVLGKIEELQTPLYDLFVLFWENGTIPDIKIEGYSISYLQKHRGMNTIAAFLTLDWLIREPEVALKSLQKGYDHPHN